MLIFDFHNPSFLDKRYRPAQVRAEAFVKACQRRGTQAWLWPNQDAMHEAFERGEAGSDIFPFQLNGVLVTVERDGDSRKDLYFEHLVKRHGGTFAGT